MKRVVFKVILEEQEDNLWVEFNKDPAAGLITLREDLEELILDHTQEDGGVTVTLERYEG